MISQVTQMSLKIYIFLICYSPIKSEILTSVLYAVNFTLIRRNNITDMITIHYVYLQRYYKIYFYYVVVYALYSVPSFIFHHCLVDISITIKTFMPKLHLFTALSFNKKPKKESLRRFYIPSVMK